MHIRLANVSDLPDVTSGYIAAFEPDPISPFLHPHRHQYPESYRRFVLDDVKDRFLAPRSIVMVAETDPEDPGSEGKKQIAGAAFWRRWSAEAVVSGKELEKNSYAQSMS